MTSFILIPTQSEPKVEDVRQWRSKSDTCLLASTIVAAVKDQILA